MLSASPVSISLTLSQQGRYLNQLCKTSQQQNYEFLHQAYSLTTSEEIFIPKRLDYDVVWTLLYTQEGSDVHMVKS